MWGVFAWQDSISVLGLLVLQPWLRPSASESQRSSRQDLKNIWLALAEEKHSGFAKVSDRRIFELHFQAFVLLPTLELDHLLSVIMWKNRRSSFER